MLVVSRHWSSLRWGWASRSLSSVLFLRHIPLSPPHPAMLRRRRRRHPRRWPRCCTSMSAFIRWAGDRSHGFTLLIFSQRGHGTTGLRWPRALSGCGVRSVKRRPFPSAHACCSPLDFVVAKVTPTIETNLGYKLFMLFGTINIGGMAVFSL